MIWTLLLCLQAPAIEEVRSVKIGAADCVFLQSSQTGKYLLLGMRPRALGRPATLQVYTAADLLLAKEFELGWTTAGFDEEDQHLEVVGRDLLRFRPGDWAELSRDALEDADFREVRNGLRCRQAWLYPDGSVLYRSKGGGVRHGDWDAGKLVSKVILSPDDNPEFTIAGVIGMTPHHLILDLGGRAGLLSGKRVYYLICSGGDFFAESSGGVTVLVGTQFESTFNPRTWRLTALRSDDEDGPVPNIYFEKSSEGRRSAASLDRKSGWVFVAGEKGLRSWNSLNMRETVRYPAVQGPCMQVAIDHTRRLMYTLEADQLRCWRFRE